VTTYDHWHHTPQWLRWLGKPKWRRQRYASWMIGGGRDGFEYSDGEVATPCPACGVLLYSADTEACRDIQNCAADNR
jgi:hypothetical protein